MKFTLHISTDSKRKDIKERCCEVLAEFLKKEGYFSVEFDPKEIDTDKLGKDKVKVMTTNGAPEKLWWSEGAVWHTNPNSIRYVEYVRKDAFVEKAKKWFEKQNEWRDINGIKHCDMESFENFIQYVSIESGIKAHAEDYSFNIESELFQQLNKEQQELWRKEIEQACMSGGYCGLNLGLDKRYDKEEPVSNDFEMALAEMVDNAQKCVVEPWVVAAQWKDELIKLAKSEEPVSEELEEAAYHNCIDRLSKESIEDFKAGAKWGKEQTEIQIKIQSTALPNECPKEGFVSEDLEKAAKQYEEDAVFYAGRNISDFFKAGAKWQKTKNESITEDLGEYINELSKQFPEVSFAKLSRIAVRVAKWQKQQIKKAMDLGEPPYLISVEQAYYSTLKLLED